MTTSRFLLFLLMQTRAASLWSRVMRLGLALGVAAILTPLPASANLPSNAYGEVTENSVKAAFLYRFIGYVEWPPAAFRTVDSPYVIAVIGADDIASKLRRLLVGRTAGDRAVEVRQLGVNDALDQVHVLYAGDLAPAQMETLLRRSQHYPILSVTDFSDVQDRPSAIQFKTIENRVRFDVALDIAERSNLRISSRMLAVAHQVKRSGP